MLFIASPIVIYKNLKSTSRYLYNHKQTVGLMKKKKADIDAPCSCHKIDGKYKRNGHVNTGNMQVLYNIANKHYHKDVQKLVHLMEHSTKFIEKPVLTQKTVFGIYASAVSEFKEKLMNYHCKKSAEDKVQYDE